MIGPEAQYGYGLGHVQRYSSNYEPPWWEILGVSQNASGSEINRAYRQKAKLAHPDHGGSEDAMKRLNIARSKGLAAR